ncbi:redoxin domain-containing protein [Hephaestia sp. GCM10023244]|uniref:redoxin domain-containing protein n=1 Tax=unclassified Hephaestia TaxID=2631281 RepID=UPI002076DE2E|nr:redoxin domain-containing protein [Hephaestia sp. MAHUQ-44]MCM8730800.1 redoxin domain-containing protein [Hephaestia sp. MAHUQ-44]
MGYIDGMDQGKFGDAARFPVAPEWQVDRWLNSGGPLSLAALRGRIVVAVAFQMLCPGCVVEALPQAQRAAASFAAADVAVIGLHTVFEHHAAQGTPEALAAFLHEYRIGFPVAIDAHRDDDPLPATMRTYAMRGTPTLLLIDREGRLRLNHFGHLDDMRLGAAIATLIAEGAAQPLPTSDSTGPVCRV